MLRSLSLVVHPASDWSGATTVLWRWVIAARSCTLDGRMSFANVVRACLLVQHRVVGVVYYNVILHIHRHTR